MAYLFLMIAATAVMWGGWPLVARSAGSAGPMTTLTLSAVAIVPVLLVTALRGEYGLPSSGVLLKLAVAGTMMGCGLLTFNQVAANRLADISVTVPIVNTGMMLVTVIGGIWLFREAISPEKVIGATFLIVGIFLLRPS